MPWTSPPRTSASSKRLSTSIPNAGRRSHAARALLRLGDAHLRQGQQPEAVQAWQQAIQQEPESREPYQRLAASYLQSNRPDLALRAILTEATLCDTLGLAQDALALVQEALALDPTSTVARQLQARLAPLVESVEPAPQPVRPPASPPARDLAQAAPPARDPAQVGSPAEAAQQRALHRLSEPIGDKGTRTLVLDAMRARAVSLQTSGRAEEAVEAFEEILAAGGVSNELFFTLGTLYQTLFRLDDAVMMYRRTTASPEYALAAHFAMGQCFQGQGRMEEALTAFLAALHAIDMEEADREHVDDIMGVYEGLADAYEARGEHEQASHVIGLLVEFLLSRGWDDKLNELRVRLGGDSEPLAAELLSDTDSAMVRAAIAAIGAYRQQGYLRAALDEVYAAMAVAPFHLPLHDLLAELLWAAERPAEAITKLMAVAALYEARGAPKQALRSLRRAHALAPTDLHVRNCIIDLLVAHGEIDEALEHFLALADGFYQEAQEENALEKLNEALRLAPRAREANEWMLKIQWRLADLYMQRLEWRRAVAAYEGILSLAPATWDAAQRAAELYLKMGAEERALVVIETAADSLIAREGPQPLLDFLERLVGVHPDSVSLLRLAGEHHAATGNAEQAAHLWEKAVELLVRRQERAQAAALLRRIVSLRSANEKRYRAMLNFMMKG